MSSFPVFFEAGTIFFCAVMGFLIQHGEESMLLISEFDIKICLY